MDALALLCNLYGDGPATLKRLRSAGLSSVESLEQIEAPGLAQTLETTEAAARRFLREARLLGERIVESGFEDEVRPPIASELIAPGGHTGTVPIVELEDDVEDGEAAELEAEPESGDHESLVEEVLSTWRERDILVRGDWDDSAAAEVVVEDPAELPEAEATSGAVEGTPLELRMLDGLSRSWCERLAACGLETVEQLADMDTLAVAEELGEGLTRLDRFRFLARRFLAGPEPAAAADDVLVPRPPKVASHPLVEAPPPGNETRFSLSEAPLGVATSPLARELDRAAGPTAAASRPDQGDPGSAGPFG